MKMSAGTEPKRVLVVCTGNSCRSIMAEALINTRGAGRYRAFSAGSRPAGHVHPRAVRTLERHGIEVGTPRSKSWDEFTGQRFDYVITVCDAAAAESCPAFVGEFTRLDWGIPDPARMEGSDEAVDGAFERTFLELQARISKELP